MNFNDFQSITLTKCSDLFLTIYLLFRGSLPIQNHLDMIFYEILNTNTKLFKNRISDVSSPKHLSKMTPIHSLLNECIIQKKKEIIRTPKNKEKSFKINLVKEKDANLTFSSYIIPKN